jgi:hypothetical protein
MRTFTALSSYCSVGCVYLCLFGIGSTGCAAFAPQQVTQKKNASPIQHQQRLRPAPKATAVALHANFHQKDVKNGEKDTNPSSRTGRRQFFSRATALTAGSAAAASAGWLAGFAAPEPASATYSAYTHREEDWRERQTSGEVTYSTARELRSQLRAIVPQNNDGRSKIFCPNGPSAAVSPLMENRCDDVRQALPSVYGRTQDALGNSIPGFAGGFYTSGGGAGAGGGSGGSALAMPEYGFAQGKKKETL